MADLAREKGRTERYLPKAAWASMSAEERRATDEKRNRLHEVNLLTLTLKTQKRPNALVGKLALIERPRRSKSHLTT